MLQRLISTLSITSTFQIEIVQTELRDLSRVTEQIEQMGDNIDKYTMALIKHQLKICMETYKKRRTRKTKIKAVN